MIEFVEAASNALGAAKEAEGLTSAIFDRIVTAKDRRKKQELAKYSQKILSEIYYLRETQDARPDLTILDELTKIKKAIASANTNTAKALELGIKREISDFFDIVEKALLLLDEMNLELRVNNDRNFYEIRRSLFARREIFLFIESADLTNDKVIEQVRALMIPYGELINNLRNSSFQLSAYLSQII